MLSKHTLQMQTRERVGSRYANRARQQGLLPAVVYGHKEPPVPVAIDRKTTIRFISDGERIFKVSVDGGSESTVLLKDLQYDHLGTNIIHADFERVDLDEVVTTSVHIRFTGEAPGEKVSGAVFVHPMEILHVRCKVRDLPEHLDVDISNLQAGETIHVSDLKLPDGMTALDPADRRVCAVTYASATTSSTTDESAEADAASPAEPQAIKQKAEDND